MQRVSYGIFMHPAAILARIIHRPRTAYETRQEALSGHQFRVRAVAKGIVRPDNGHMRNDQGSSRQAAGIAVGVLGSIGVAGAMVGVRGEIANADVALILMVCVLAGAVIGGRVAGVLSALAAAMSFDFFHTKPYATLKIANKDDVITTL